MCSKKYILRHFDKVYQLSNSFSAYICFLKNTLVITLLHILNNSLTVDPGSPGIVPCEY